jgi:DNA-binding PadR family transcriptional regulator
MLNNPLEGIGVSTQLVILGLLRERPLYGYEIKHIIEERMGDWTNIAFGSIYYALDRLADDQLIEEVVTEQEGGRPSRTIYRVTEAGREAFLRLLREVWSEVERHYFAFDVGLTFMRALPIGDVKDYLRKRVAQLEAILRHLHVHQQEQMAHVELPRLAAAVFDHSRAHFQAELGWTQDLLEKVEQRIYP